MGNAKEDRRDCFSGIDTVAIEGELGSILPHERSISSITAIGTRKQTLNFIYNINGMNLGIFLYLFFKHQF
jgi:hypothetical protein